MESEAVSLKVQVSEGKAYKMGELFKNGNTVVKAVFSDGTEREIEDYTVKGFNPGKEGSQNVEISYYGLKQSISVNVEKEPQPANPGFLIFAECAAGNRSHLANCPVRGFNCGGDSDHGCLRDFILWIEAIHFCKRGKRTAAGKSGKYAGYFH